MKKLDEDKLKKHLLKIKNTYNRSIPLNAKKTKILYNVCKYLSKDGSFTIEKIDEKVCKKFNIKKFSDNTQAQDYCYNTINLNCCTPKFLIKTDTGIFEFKDIDWQPASPIDVTWTQKSKSSRIIGQYLKNGFDWNQI